MLVSYYALAKSDGENTTTFPCEFIVTIASVTLPLSSVILLGDSVVPANVLDRV